MDISNDKSMVPDRAELWALAEAVCLGKATDEQLGTLNTLLLANEDAAVFYATYLQMHGHLEWYWRDGTVTSDKNDSIDDPVSSAQGPPAFVGQAMQGSVCGFSSAWPVAYLMAAVIVGIGLLVGSLMPVAYQERPSVVRTAEPLLEGERRFVGQITGMVDCQWSDPHTAALDRAFVPLGRKYALAAGLMEITYNTGARVILQGPCTYEVDSVAGGYLAVGKLTARVEKKGSGFGVQRSESTNPKSQINESEIPPNSRLSILDSRLFTVRTPTATVTDLGTEFGVEVGENGDTESHVFRGSVELRVISGKARRESAVRILRDNEAARVESSNDSGIALVDVATAHRSDGFVRAMPRRTIKSLDLADIVAGGNGDSCRRDRGIDPTTGQIVESLDVGPAGTPAMQSDGQYHRVPVMPFVDGVFVPDGRLDDVQVDSAGHRFAGFRGSANATWQHIWAGGLMTDPRACYPTEVAGVDYGVLPHGVLLLHANNAITFDLDAIRHANSDGTPVRFSAVLCNVETASQQGVAAGADAWVLVDGRERFKRSNVTRWNGAIPVAVPLGPTDRFLTLVATDGGNGISNDFVIFADPRLGVLAK